MTKKDLLEAIEDMPIDAEIKYVVYRGEDNDPWDYSCEAIDQAVCVEHLNEILLC